MPTDLTCPGCHHPLDVISASGSSRRPFCVRIATIRGLPLSCKISKSPPR